MKVLDFGGFFVDFVFVVMVCNFELYIMFVYVFGFEDGVVEVVVVVGVVDCVEV